MNTNLKNQVLYNSGATVHIINNFKIEDRLPPRNYQLKMNRQSGEIFLEETNEFKLPEKLYGDFDDIEYYLKSFENSEKNVGIYLQGEKGTGKTLFAHKLCIDSKRPVIMVDDSSIFGSSNIFNFLNSEYLNNSILLFDEFEKTFDQKEMNNSLLNLIKIFDGNLMSKFMFIVTSNTDNINEFFKNRLNRIKYRKVYSTLSDQTIENIIDDMLVYTNYKEELLIELNDLNFITMDILINIIKDINLFNLPPSVIFPKLNLYKLPQIMKSYFKINDFFIIDNNIKQECGSILDEYGIQVDNILDIKNNLKGGKTLIYNAEISSIYQKLLNDLFDRKYLICLYYYHKKDEIIEFYEGVIEDKDVTKPECSADIKKELYEHFKSLDSDTIKLLNGIISPDEYIDKYLKVDNFGLLKIEADSCYDKETYQIVFKKEIEDGDMPYGYYDIYKQINNVEKLKDILNPNVLTKKENNFKYIQLINGSIKNMLNLKKNDVLDLMGQHFHTYLSYIQIQILELEKINKLNYNCKIDMKYNPPKYMDNIFNSLDLNRLKDIIEIKIELLSHNVYAYSENKLNSEIENFNKKMNSGLISSKSKWR